VKTYDAVIIGGGFYGLRIALYLKEQLGIGDILVIEKETGMMTRASYANQARVHNGYHYPRSVLTALRSRVNFPVFVDEYGEAVVSNFDKYYAVSKKLSKVNAKQFKEFCQKIGADIEPASTKIKDKFNPYLTDGVFKVREYAFDSWKLRDLLMNRIGKTDITHHNGEEVVRVSEAKDGVAVESDKQTYLAKRIINCGYSQLNKLNRASGLALVPLKHEITEMCLVKLPRGMEDFSITVMDGPFFSIMPFPTRGLSTVSHVRYTPHTEWRDDGTTKTHDPHGYFAANKMKSNFPQMYADVVRYIPELRGMQYVESVWEVKTVLVQSEGDDSRPILFRSDLGLNNYTCIMGGKLDNIYDVFKELDGLYERQ
jgi:glycine/D-amino acid oxidase-like deaminating enzyme